MIGLPTADGKVYALKQVALDGMKRVDREEAIDEARMLSQLYHPYIIQYYDSFIGKPSASALPSRIRSCLCITLALAVR